MMMESDNKASALCQCDTRMQDTTRQTLSVTTLPTIWLHNLGEGMSRQISEPHPLSPWDPTTIQINNRLQSTQSVACIVTTISLIGRSQVFNRYHHALGPTSYGIQLGLGHNGAIPTVINVSRKIFTI